MIAEARTNPQRHVLGLVLVLALSFALKLGALVVVGDIQAVKDEAQYVAAGQSVAAGNGIRYTNPLWNDIHAPPLYPWFLGLIFALGGGTYESKLVQVLLSTATVGFIYLLARALSGERAGLAAAALFAFDPTLVAFTHYNWIETFFVFWLVPAFLFLFGRAGEIASGKRIVLAGLLFGVTALTRDVVLYLLPLLVLWLFVETRDRRATLQRGALLLGSAALVILPWTLHIRAEYGGFLPVSSAPTKLWHDSYNAVPPWNQDLGLDRFEERMRLEREGKMRPMSREKNPVLRAREETRKGLEFLRENPGLCLERFGVRVAQFLNPTSFLIRHLRKDYYTRGPQGQVIREPVPRGIQEVLVWLTLASYIGGCLLAVVGLFSMPRGAARSFLLLTLAYFVIVYGLSYAMSRYRLAITPTLAIAAGYALAHPGECRRQLQKTPKAIGAACVTLLLVLVWSRYIGNNWLE